MSLEHDVKLKYKRDNPNSKKYDNRKKSSKKDKANDQIDYIKKDL